MGGVVGCGQLAMHLFFDSGGEAGHGQEQRVAERARVAGGEEEREREEATHWGDARSGCDRARLGVVVVWFAQGSDRTEGWARSARPVGAVRALPGLAAGRQR
ncbi:hypothetical protein V8J82_11900 [Gymnodinialimonas sp. 2305UL16-5]|uniref:hypothetical protein n=1 Tax=Gymnodinialimonas mytili TaxID=3126503 RepID=UPI0030B59370